jgi:hypothetical protein
MNGFNNMNPETLLQLAALSGAQSQGESHEYDDYDDYDSADFAGESWDDEDDDYESWDDDEDEYESIDESWDDEDDDYESAENFDGESRRRRRLRRRGVKVSKAKWKTKRRPKIARARGKKTVVLQSSTGQAMRVKFGGQGFVTPQKFNAAVAKTEREFALRQKQAKANYDKLASQVARNSKTLSARVRSVSKEVEKLKSSAQTTQLMSMLNQGPQITKMKVAGTERAISDVEYASSTTDMMLPLLMSGGLGGGDNSQMMMMMMMLMNNNNSSST